MITNCVITGNTAVDGGGGGGIYCSGSSPTIINCDISGNSAYHGGGVYCGDEGSGPIVINCTFTNNSAQRDGGAIGATPNGGGPIINCTFMWNAAGDDGGALEHCSGPIINCVIIGNRAVDAGGGLYKCSGSITDSAITGNSAQYDGGGFYNYYSDESLKSITNCTITGNGAGWMGGGMYNLHCGPILTNCIVWGNTDSNGTGESSQISSEPSHMGYVTFSCIQDDDPNDANIPFGGSANNNIDDNPMFVRDPNDGGDGWGVGGNDDFGDLHLQNSSPCIDTGDPFLPVAPNSVDMDGQPRIMGSTVDMGADEFFIPMLVVTRPEGGEVWVAGSLHEITWYSQVYEGPVDILFSEDAGNNWETVESNLPDTGSYMWHLPDIVDSNQCLISVEPNVPDPNVLCTNSGLFTIHPDSLHPEVPSKWKSLGGDFRRAGLSENYGPQLGCVKWQFDTEGAVSASITVGAGDRVHIACEDGRVYTLDIGDGSLLWSYDTNSPLLSAPTVGPRGSVYVGSENGTLYAISIGGTLRWTHSTDGFIYSSPAVSADGNSIYVSSEDGKLYALGPEGSELWEFEPNGTGAIGSPIFASPAIAADGTVYVAGLRDPSLYALDPNNGSVKWVCDFASGGWPFASPVVAADGTIYQVLMFDPNLYAIEPNTGTIIWSTDLADPCSGWFDSGYINRYNYTDALSEPALGPDGTIYASLNDPYLRAVDPNGSIKWVTRLGMSEGSTLTVGSDSFVYAADSEGYLCVLDANGSEVARFQSESWLIFPVVSADNTIIISDANSKVWAVSGDGCPGPAYELHRPEDLDGSLSVNFMDFALFALDWLACNAPDPPCEAPVWDGTYFVGDIDRNLYVDFADVAAMSNRWLSDY
jgi:outer membrane protein assembly factor BamB